jgi:hypothetical protein
MNSELEELYREMILDHSRRPRNFGELADARWSKRCGKTRAKRPFPRKTISLGQPTIENALAEIDARSEGRKPAKR